MTLFISRVGKLFLLFVVCSSVQCGYSYGEIDTLSYSALPIDTRGCKCYDVPCVQNVAVDTRSSPRSVSAEKTQLIRFDSSWNNGSMVKVTVNDMVLTNSGAVVSGLLTWTPMEPGVYDFEHFDGGMTLSASFVVQDGARVSMITAAQRYPWNGMVDIAFTITGDADTAYQVSFTAKDVAGGTNLTMKTVEDCGRPGTSAPTALRPGDYHFVWNTAADLPDGFVAERVTINVEAK